VTCIDDSPINVTKPELDDPVDPVDPVAPLPDVEVEVLELADASPPPDTD
jgi:hypothetical protein